MQKKWDVLVAGAGPAGMAAAWAAARNGAQVLLLEKDGFAGGAITGGLANSWQGTASSGFSQLMQQTCTRAWGKLIIDPEQAAELFRRIIAERRICLYTQADVCSARVSEKSFIEEVQAKTPQGMMTFLAACCVDATGDGDLAALAGAPFELDGVQDGGTTAVLMMLLGGIDTRSALCFSKERFAALVPKLRQMTDRGEFPARVKGLRVSPGFRGGTGVIGIELAPFYSAVDAGDTAAAEMESRAAVAPLVDFLRKDMPGYADCFLMRTASRAGILAGRRVQGRYRVVFGDIAEGRVFEDWVVSRAAVAPQDGDEPGIPFTLPYRCLLPKRIRNLLLAGRCISGDGEAAGYFRAMPVCAATGQAAGTAAAMAALLCEGRARRVDVRELQDRLLEQGAAPPRPGFMLRDLSAAPACPTRPDSDDEDEEELFPTIPSDAGMSLRPETDVPPPSDGYGTQGSRRGELWDEPEAGETQALQDVPDYCGTPERGLALHGEDLIGEETEPVAPDEQNAAETSQTMVGECRSEEKPEAVEPSAVEPAGENIPVTGETATQECRLEEEFEAVEPPAVEPAGEKILDAGETATQVCRLEENPEGTETYAGEPEGDNALQTGQPAAEERRPEGGDKATEPFAGDFSERERNGVRSVYDSLLDMVLHDREGCGETGGAREEPACPEEPSQETEGTWEPSEKVAAQDTVPADDGSAPRPGGMDDGAASGVEREHHGKAYQELLELLDEPAAGEPAGRMFSSPRIPPSERTKEEPKEQAPPKPRVTLRRDGKSPLDIDVQDLL